ncbi:MAG TPA: wax ester/triacylglycerol synthase family O-acyltransferase [Aldersonia sp.]
MSKRIPPLDLSWLVLESPDTPMHVGGLLTFALPDDAPADFLQRIATRLRAERRFEAPWNLQVSRSLRDKLMPRWVEEKDVDLDHHFRHVALPAPGGELELGNLVSELHSRPLDLRRPLWELHLIEGLAPNRFAVYLKIHHSLIDGVSVMRLLMDMLSDNPDDTAITPIWTVPATAPAPAGRRNALPSVSGVVRATTGLVDAFTRPLRDDTLVAPYSSPRSSLSAPMNAQRRFTTTRAPLADLKAAAAASGGTVNDIVLWLCATALRGYLHETDKLPTRSLTAAVPVNLRDDADFSVGTNIGHLLTNLATDETDPKQRLEKIIASTRAAKNHMEAMPREARYPYTLAATSSIALGQLTKLDGLVPPMFSLVVSNVPGPKHSKYLAGAKLEAVYPISLLMRGGALNITVVTVDGVMNFGFVGARDALPHLQRLGTHLDEAVTELPQLTTGRMEASHDARQETRPRAYR